jgi:glyoxylase-like metal-dependent hydrolase (beta-lactamase superfamily II)
MEIFKLVFSPIEVNTYILTDGSGECAIIDCGCYGEGEGKKLEGFLSEKKLTPVLLLNTHCHLDHVFGNGFMLEKYGIRSHFCELEEPIRRNAPQHAMIFGLEMEAVPDPAAYLSHNSEIGFGNILLKAIHVPGHTAGSLAFYSEKDECVFTGDALFAGSIGRTDLPGGNHQTLLTAIKTNLLTLPGETVVYAGHGPETTIERERKSNPYLT